MYKNYMKIYCLIKNLSEIIIWATSWENLFYAIYEQQRRISTCASVQSDQRLCCSLTRWFNTSSFYIWNFKPLACLCSWAGRFESHLVANPWRQVFSWRGSFHGDHLLLLKSKLLELNSSETKHRKWIEPCHEIMVLFVLRKLILQTRMRNHPRASCLILVGPFVYFHTSCVRKAKALARLRGCTETCGQRERIGCETELLFASQ